MNNISYLMNQKNLNILNCSKILLQRRDHFFQNLRNFQGRDAHFFEFPVRFCVWFNRLKQVVGGVEFLGRKKKMPQFARPKTVLEVRENMILPNR